MRLFLSSRVHRWRERLHGCAGRSQKHPRTSGSSAGSSYQPQCRNVVTQATKSTKRGYGDTKLEAQSAHRHANQRTHMDKDTQENKIRTPAPPHPHIYAVTHRAATMQLSVGQQRSAPLTHSSSMTPARGHARTLLSVK